MEDRLGNLDFFCVSALWAWIQRASFGVCRLGTEIEMDCLLCVMLWEAIPIRNV